MSSVPDAASNDTPDPALHAQHWIALINEHVELVRFDDDSVGSVTSLADSGLEATAAFTGNGKRLAFGVRTGQGAWEVKMASAPDGATLPGVWSVPGTTTPTLVWGGDDALVATRSAEASYLLQIGDGAVTDIGERPQLGTVADRSALVAVIDSRILYLGPSATTPTWSEPISGSWLAQLSADGQGLVVLSQSEIPAFDFPVATTRIRWSPPAAPVCSGSLPTDCHAASANYAPGYLDWPSASSRIVVEFDDSSGDVTLMDLAFVQPGDNATLSAPKGMFPVLRRNWGVQRDGTWFIVENPTNPLTESWWLRSVQVSGRVSRAQGPTGAAQYAVSSGDDGTLFVVSYSKAATTTTVYAFASPVLDNAKPKAIFATDQRISTLWPQPNGSGAVIEIGIPPDVVSYAFVPDPDAPAQSLPSGLHDVQWTPDGHGFVGILGDNTVYFAAKTPEQPITLGRGSYVLPSQ